MSYLKPLLAASALALMLAAAPQSAFAQDAMKDKAKNMAVDKAKDVAKDKAAEELKGTTGMAADKAIDVGADMAKGKSAKDAAMGAVTGSAKSDMKAVIVGDEAVTSPSMTGAEMKTAGEVMIKGGSAEDAAMEVAKDRVMDRAKGEAMKHGKAVIYSGTSTSGSTTASTSTTVSSESNGVGGTLGGPSMTTTTTTTLAVNCPSGTTAQPDGTCMITGDYNPG